MSTNLACVLDDYVSQGLVTILDWNGVPLVSQKEIRTENMFASLNDCLYRGMHKHKYLAFLDFDEYMMPKKHDSLTDLLQDLEGQEANFSMVMFRNAFFYLQWPDDRGASNTNLMTLKKTRRNKYLHKANMRSKYICKPEEVVEVGNHFVWESRAPQAKQLVLGIDEGFLHHYRICEFGGDDCIRQSSEKDRTTWKWKSSLSNAVDKVQQRLGGVCDLAHQSA
jgi:Glycosyltransferase family 92